MNEVEDLPFKHIHPAIDDPWPGPVQILLQERHNVSLLFNHTPVASGVGNRPQRQGRHRPALIRCLLQGSQINVEERIPVHHEEIGIERFARDRQCAGGAEWDRLPQHPDRGVANPAPVVGRFKNLSEIASEEEDILIAVAFDHLKKVVEERSARPRSAASASERLV